MAKGIPNPNTPEYIKMERIYHYLENIITKRSKELNKETKKLREKNRILKSRIISQNKIIETLKLQIEELQKMVFGRKNKSNDKNDSFYENPNKDKKELVIGSSYGH